MKVPALSLPLLLVLAACGSEVPESDQPEGDPAGPVASADDGGIEPDAAQAEQASIPQALRGRWGVAASDCEPGGADAEGLLVIDADSLEFYESVATLEDIDDRDETRIHAGFAFTGEGMDWDREMELVTTDDGATLIRREHGEGAAPEAFRYVRCA